MKFFVVIGMVVITHIACQGNDRILKEANKKIKDTTNFTSIKWIDSLKDIGTILPGKVAEINFRFINNGTKPLYVIDAKPGCGCTIADYQKAAILPGNEGVIKANYNVHKDGQGDFRKNIKVTTNTKGSTDTYIFFYGTIKGDTASTNVKLTDSIKPENK